MDTEHLEQQLSVWKKLMYVALGSAIVGSAATYEATVMLSSVGSSSTAVGVIWLVLLVVVTLPGLFLLFGKRWKVLPLSSARICTPFGYLLAGWLLLSVPILLGGGDTYNFFFFACTAFLGLLYWRVREKSSKPEETFP